MTDYFPILYILVRDDLPLSMTMGRAAAQSSHATSVFHEHFNYLIDSAKDGSESTDGVYIDKYLEWKKQTPYNYGTVVVKKMSYDKMLSLEHLQTHYGFFAKIVVDPEYKLRDGALVFTALDVPTTMVMFGPNAGYHLKDVPYL